MCQPQPIFPWNIHTIQHFSNVIKKKLFHTSKWIGFSYFIFPSLFRSNYKSVSNLEWIIQYSVFMIIHTVPSSKIVHIAWEEKKMCTNISGCPMLCMAHTQIPTNLIALSNFNNISIHNKKQNFRIPLKKIDFTIFSLNFPSKLSINDNIFLFHIYALDSYTHAHKHWLDEWEEKCVFYLKKKNEFRFPQWICLARQSNSTLFK